MQFNDPADDGQAEARTAKSLGAGFFHPVKLIKDPRQIGGRDLRAGVGDGQVYAGPGFS